MRVVFHGGRIVTAGPDGVIENGILIVDDGRIGEVGAAGEIEVPGTDAQLIDLEGQTAIPGLIDLHGHVCGFTAAETAAPPTASGPAGRPHHAPPRVTACTAEPIASAVLDHHHTARSGPQDHHTTRGA